jgi:hypothetical protein
MIVYGQALLKQTCQCKRHLDSGWGFDSESGYWVHSKVVGGCGKPSLLSSVHFCDDCEEFKFYPKAMKYPELGEPCSDCY